MDTKFYVIEDVKRLPHASLTQIADDCSSIIDYANMQGRKYKRLMFVNRIFKLLEHHRHDTDTDLADYLDNYFDDHVVLSIHKLLLRTRDYYTWKQIEPCRKLIKKYRKNGYRYVDCNAKPKPLGFHAMVDLLWMLNDKLEAMRELDDWP